VQGTRVHGKEKESFVERADLLNTLQVAPARGAPTLCQSQTVLRTFCVRAQPTADPHGGWCGGWELETPGYPIRRQLLRYVLYQGLPVDEYRSSDQVAASVCAYSDFDRVSS